MTYVKAETHSAVPPAIDALLERARSLNNVSVSYELTRRVNPDPRIWQTLTADDKTHVSEADFRNRVETYICSFRFLGGKAEWKSAPNDATINDFKKNGGSLHGRTERMIVPGRQDNLHLLANRSEASGTISGDDTLPGDTFIETTLGLRVLCRRHWLASDELQSATVLNENPNGVAVELYRGGKGALTKLVLDEKLKYSVRSAHVAMSARPEDEGYSMECSDFRQVQNVWIPFVSVEKVIARNESGQLAVEAENAIRIKSCRIDSLENTPESFQMKWPSNSYFVDSRVHEAFGAGSHERVFSDSDIATELAERAAEKRKILERAQKRIDAVSTQPSP